MCVWCGDHQNKLAVPTQEQTDGGSQPGLTTTFQQLKRGLSALILSFSEILTQQTCDFRFYQGNEPIPVNTSQMFLLSVYGDRPRQINKSVCHLFKHLTMTCLL